VSLPILLAAGCLCASLLMLLMFLIQKQTGDAGVVDIAWSLGVVAVVMLYAFFWPEPQVRGWLVMPVVILWGIRLSLHVLVRFLTMKPDARYEKLKEEWGAKAQWKMFRFYQMQGIGIMLFSLPPLIGLLNPQPLGWLDFLAVAIAAISIAGESLADWQLTRFRKNPVNHGKVCRSGLWYFSRHPNYFFEWLFWWTFVAFSLTWFPWTLLTLPGPFFMWYFLTQVTGIPHTEAQSLRSRGDAYREYQKTTNAFFPWFPRTNPTGK
jgi:steroid 5-alpha reductase family enzyme